MPPIEKKAGGSMKYSIIEEDLKEVYQRNITWERLRGKTVLVTGAYGMLASYIVYMLQYLNEQMAMNIQLIVVVRSEEKLRQRFGDLVSNDYFHTYISNLDKSLDISEDIHFIIHAASLASPGYYKTCPIDVLKPNTIGNYYLLELAEKKKVEGYLFFSTGDVYGVVEGRETIHECDYGSMDTLDIHNCYSESKRMAETMCRAWQEQKNIPVKIIRICHTYAPTMDVEHDPRVFASFVNDILKKKDIIMKSNGVSKRTFCYIADALAAFFLVLFNGRSGEAYNVCNTGEFYSIAELANMLVELYPQLDIKVVCQKRAEGEAYVENSVANSIPHDNEKLRRLGWEPKYDIKTGFGRVVDAIMQMEGMDKKGEAYADDKHFDTNLQ